MGKGKGSSQSTTVEMPEEIEEAARRNQNLVNNIAAIGYTPNFGLTTAAFTPAQEAAFANTNNAANAFGMQSASGTGLPQAQNVGGFSGYSTSDLYNNSVNSMDPQQLARLRAVSANPFSENPFQQQQTAATGSGKGGSSGKNQAIANGGTYRV